jgi:Histidine kinase-, DNA gyrase B-, and HSP90-like ATPase
MSTLNTPTPTTDDLDGLVLRFGGRLVEQLGAQMYPSATATVAELISNAWDADAENVWVEMPFGDWENGEIVVIDDGLGMTHDDARDAYLIVGRNRREGNKQRSPGGRLVHGRKGIGKLAAFGTATVLDLYAQKLGERSVSFRLDYEKIRAQRPDDPYRVEASEDPGALVNPTSRASLPHGTRIRLTGIRLKRALNKDSFMRSMSRRFALNDHEMKVIINGEELKRFDLDLDIRFPQQAAPPGVTVEDGWAVETLSNGEQVRWWIGFTHKPLRGEAEQGVTVLVRGKLAQRPFKFERNSGGTTGQLGQEYLVGEVIADWIDDEDADADNDSDYIQSNRDQLQLEDSHLGPFLNWGQTRLAWALNQRNEIRSERTTDHLESIEPLGRLLDDFSSRERTGLMRVAEAVSRLPEVDDSALVRVMEAVVDTREGHTARTLAEQISVEGFDPAKFWPLLEQLAELDDRNALAFVDARLDTLDQLGALDVEATLVTSVRRVLELNPGLLDPTWETAEAVERPAGMPDAAVFVIAPRGSNPLAVLVVADDAVGARAAQAQAERHAGGAPTMSVLPTPTDSGATTWQQLIDASRTLHENWRQILDDRVGRSRR